MNKVFIFTLGAAVGSLLTWKLIEEKYKQIADEEIESIREHYKSKLELYNEPIKSSSDVTKEDLEMDEYENKVTKYLGYVEPIEPIEYEPYEVYIEPGVDYIEPHVITPEEYGDTGYDTKSWTYYADLVLTDEDDEIVCDVENIIGNALTHFGEYEDNYVYVRNDNTECDYAILKYERTFVEVNGGE